MARLRSTATSVRPSPSPVPAELREWYVDDWVDAATWVHPYRPAHPTDAERHRVQGAMIASRQAFLAAWHHWADEVRARGGGAPLRPPATVRPRWHTPPVVSTPRR